LVLKSFSKKSETISATRKYSWDRCIQKLGTGDPRRPPPPPPSSSPPWSPPALLGRPVGNQASTSGRQAVSMVILNLDLDEHRDRFDNAAAH
jgi:hypothetical protein